MGVGFGRSTTVAATLGAAAVPLGACADDPIVVPDPGSGAIAGGAGQEPYDHVRPSEAPMPRLPEHPNVGPPLLADDPGPTFAREVLARHDAEIRALPGWQAHGISRHDGRTVIVVTTLRPLPDEERIAELEGVPLFYTVGGPFFAF